MFAVDEVGGGENGECEDCDEAVKADDDKCRCHMLAIDRGFPISVDGGENDDE